MDAGFSFLNQCKEDFGEAYVRSVAAAAGCWIDRLDRDFDGIDVMITRYGNAGLIPDAPLRAQLKSTHGAHVGPDTIRYPLSIKNYDKLRLKRSTAPAVLILVLVPEDPVEWVEQDETDLHLLRAGYWLNLLGAPEVSNTEKKTVEVPRSQLLTVAELERIMDLVVADNFP